MVILIRATRVIKGETLFCGKVIEKYPNDYNFGFDIFAEMNWVHFLKSKYKGTDEYGFKTAYEVQIYGSDKYIESLKPPKEFYYVHPTSKKLNLNNIISLFPGREEDSNKNRDLAKWGVLDRY